MSYLQKSSISLSLIIDGKFENSSSFWAEAALEGLLYV